MQSSEYLREVKGKIFNHLHWMKDQSQGERADFCYGDMQGIALRELKLSRALFAGADLRGADLSRADLRQAVFYCADLEGANFEGADLRGADLRGACLNDAKLANANLTGADLSSRAAADGEVYAEIARYDRKSGHHLHVTEMVDADMTGADVQRAQLVGCDLTGALLDGARLCGADFSESLLFGASFEEAEFGEGDTAPNFANAMLDGEALALLETLRIASDTRPPDALPCAELSRLLEAHERWLESRGREGRRLSVDMKRIHCDQLQGRDLTMASFRRCDLTDATFSDSKLTLANLAYSTLTAAQFERANLSGADMRKTNLNKANFTDAIMNRAQVKGSVQGRPTNLTKARGAEAIFKVAETDQAILFGADLRGAMLNIKFLGGANKSGALLPESVLRRSAAPAPTGTRTNGSDSVPMASGGTSANGRTSGGQAPVSWASPRRTDGSSERRW